jgi:hypothetical protein
MGINEFPLKASSVAQFLNGPTNGSYTKDLNISTGWNIPWTPPEDWEKFLGLFWAPIDLATQLHTYLAAGQKKKRW